VTSPLHVFRVLRTRYLLRRARVVGGAQARFLNRRVPHLSNCGAMHIGPGLRVDCFFSSARLHTEPGALLRLGARVYLNSGAHLFARQRIEIGDDTRIAEDVYLSDTDFHEVAPGVPPRTAPIVIGRNVWIGRRAIILPGVTVGDHVVVGAGSVVTRDLPARAVAAGVPAKVLRTIECPDDWVRR
jgi:acetyltransferase-like isoleucine patch superfamily enzyme